MGFRAFCNISAGALLQNVAWDHSTTHVVGSVFGCCSAILGGIPALTPSNINCGDLSVILMGDSNGINTFSGPPNGLYNTIINGNNNSIGGGSLSVSALPADYSFIGGGSGNCIDTTTLDNTHYAIIGGGQNNCIVPAADYAVISGGFSNHADGLNSFIGSGDSNIAGGSCSVIGGGCCNKASADYAAIAGGVNNQTNGIASFIGSGDTNTIIGNPDHPNCSSIVGGQLNNIGCIGTAFIPFDYSFIGGGIQNNIFSEASSIVGGALNTVCSCGSFIGGGEANLIDINAVGSVIGGGGYCDFSAPLSHGNCIRSNFSFIGSGTDNLISINSDCSFIGGGGGYDTVALTVLGNNIGALAGGGLGSVYGVIGGGSNNCIDDTLWASPYSGIFGGSNNCITGNASFIGGGNTNYIRSPFGAVKQSVIAGGTTNSITDDGANPAHASFIGGGNTNNIFSSCSSIVGGQNHQVYSVSSFIGGGDTNVININSDCSFIGGGNFNNVGAGVKGSIFSVIGGGYNNCIDDTSFASSYSMIGGGSNHCANGNNLFIGGGDTNYICSVGELGPVLCSSIVGGVENLISDDSATGGTSLSNLSFIGGGV